MIVSSNPDCKESYDCGWPYTQCCPLKKDIKVQIQTNTTRTFTFTLTEKETRMLLASMQNKSTNMPSDVRLFSSEFFTALDLAMSESHDRD